MRSIAMKKEIKVFKEGGEIFNLVNWSPVVQLSTLMPNRIPASYANSLRLGLVKIGKTLNNCLVNSVDDSERGRLSPLLEKIEFVEEVEPGLIVGTINNRKVLVYLTKENPACIIK